MGRPPARQHTVHWRRDLRRNIITATKDSQNLKKSTIEKTDNVTGVSVKMLLILFMNTLCTIHPRCIQWWRLEQCSIVFRTHRHSCHRFLLLLLLLSLPSWCVLVPVSLSRIRMGFEFPAKCNVIHYLFELTSAFCCGAALFHRKDGQWGCSFVITGVGSR